VAVRFKELDRAEEVEKAVQEQEQGITRAQPAGDTKHGAKLDTAAAREAIDGLLGRRRRHEHAQAQAATRPAPGAAPAPKQPAFEAPLSVPVFSRRREVFVGRVAMAAFYASLQWEVRG
jgi:hypothetical protein